MVNISYFLDPWLYNCPDNAADSPIEHMEQRTILAATQRALVYAHACGVTKVASLGNQHTDLGKPTVDEISPNLPPGSEKTRAVDNSCLVLPGEGRNVIGVTSLGPSTAKTDRSNCGIEQADVSAPDGYLRDLAGTPQFRSPGNLILSAYPRSVALANGDTDANGLPTNDFVIRDCKAGVCAYYQYIEGTSVAAPHAAGVAALIVSQFGHRDVRRGDGGITSSPGHTQSILGRTATDRACPEPRLVSYEDVGRPPSYDALCEGGPSFNGFYGHGIVDALSAVTLRRRT